MCFFILAMLCEFVEQRLPATRGCEVRDCVFSTKVENKCKKCMSIDYIFRNLVKPLLGDESKMVNLLLRVHFQNHIMN